MEGIEQPGRINEEMLKRFKAGKSKSHSTGELIEGILGGNRTLLSKAITLVESALPGHQEQAQEVIAACLKETRNQLPMTNDQPERSGARRSQLPIVKFGILVSG